MRRRTVAAALLLLVGGAFFLEILRAPSLLSVVFGLILGLLFKVLKADLHSILRMIAFAYFAQFIVAVPQTLLSDQSVPFKDYLLGAFGLSLLSATGVVVISLFQEWRSQRASGARK